MDLRPDTDIQSARAARKVTFNWTSPSGAVLRFRSYLNRDNCWCFVDATTHAPLDGTDEFLQLPAAARLATELATPALRAALTSYFRGV